MIPRTAARVLVVAPHPDDEIIGCGGLIAALRRRQVKVRVVVVTDGAASHRSSARYPAHRLTKLRAAETRRALAQIGVTAADTVFCGFPDGGASGWSGRSQSSRRLQSALAGRWDAIVGPSRFDDHPDHRQAGAMVRRLRPDCRYLAYTVWPQKPQSDRRASRNVWSLPLKQDRYRKWMALRAYRSQRGLIRDDPEGFALSRAELQRLNRPFEKFAAA